MSLLRAGGPLALTGLVLALALAVPDGRPAAAAAPAYDLVALPQGVDSVTPLAEAARSIEACGAACGRIVYAWTPRMPLSRSGIPNIVAAAGSLGAPVVLVSTEELLDYAEGHHPASQDGLALADAMLAAGVLAHAPAVVVYASGDVAGTAILGYKPAPAYESLLRMRLDGADAPRTPVAPIATRRMRPAVDQVSVDREAVGLPGAYFRWVPGTRMVVYESGRSIYLLDLDSGENSVAPGWIDFVPTPDGRYFVTPGPGDEGLTFFDARDVFVAAEQNRSMSVESIFTDMRMRDQYPSVGILEQDASHTRYRVLTSWFEGLVYRDYDVQLNAASGAASVRPIGEPIVPCQGYALSTPIMSQTGREVAARDERTGTTKIFAIEDEGRCTEALDLGIPTSKVAWHASGRRIAFATPRRGRGVNGGAGIFVFDRDTRAITAVPASEGASRLAFPDFVGDAVVFLLPGSDNRSSSLFRLVDGIE